MELIDRIARLLRADAHGMVDALEERGLLLRQHLRDAELEVLQKRARVEALDVEVERLGKEIERREARANSLDADVELALAGGKEALARFAAARLLGERRELEALGHRRSGVAEARARVAERLAEQEHGLQELKGRARNWLAARGREAQEEFVGIPGVADEEVELELLRRRNAPEVA